MKINIFYSIEGAKKARGITVVIDVFRAFSTACYLFSAGVKKIIPIADIELAYKLKQKNQQYILVGERDGKIQPGFDFGNSPWQIRKFDWKDKIVIHTTTAGTQGIIGAIHAKEVITGSFVNASAIMRYIKMKKTKNISLICTGTANEHIANEDFLFAQYLKNALEGKENNFVNIKKFLKQEGFAHRFFDPKYDSHPAQDFNLCMDLDKFDFILKAYGKKDGEIYLKKK